MSRVAIKPHTAVQRGSFSTKPPAARGRIDRVSTKRAYSLLVQQLLPAVLLLCPALLTNVGLSADLELTYVTPRGVTYTVTENGLTTIRKGFGAIIDGNWTAFNGEDWFPDAGAGEVKIPAPEEKSLTVISPKQATVRHTAGDVICIYDYTFANDDVQITCRVENNHAKATLNVVGFSGLKFHFARPPEGVMPVESRDFFKERGLKACHPSTFSPIGGGYAVDKDVGIGVAPANRSFYRTLLLWDYADWDADERTRVLERELRYFANSPIPPGGSAEFGLTLRISPQLEWQYLLEPYRELFQKFHGTVQYRADGRWIATDHLDRTEKPVALRRTTPSETASRPTSGRGIDSSKGAQDLCDLLIPRLTEANGQGAIIWGTGLVNGVDQSGLADFNVLPPEVDENWDRITEQFASAGLKFGVATSPRHLQVRVSWEKTEQVQLNPQDPVHRELAARRYRDLVDRGCTLFYLDHFGGSLEDVQLMRFLREELGTTVRTFADEPCDALLVYSGGATGTVLKTASSAGLERGYRTQVGEKNWEIFQWLAPGCEMLGELTEVKGNLNDALEAPERFFFSRRMIPMVSVPDFKRLPSLKKLQPQYVSEEGGWLAENPR